MEYLLTFIEGFASFISPCLLPMVPIYVAYFAGDKERKTSKVLANSIAFVLGFTFVFMLLAVFASTFGILISENIKYIKIFFGLIIILLGLNYMEVLKLKFLEKQANIENKVDNMNFIKAFIFGIIFSISWTPCVGTFLSAALLSIANSQDILKGILLILCYSLGIAIPFIVSALLIDKAKKIFKVIKSNYSLVKKISGILLIAIGIYTIVSAFI